jgi:hypothetical protein
MWSGEWFGRCFAGGTFGGGAYGALIAICLGWSSPPAIAVVVVPAVMIGFGIGMVYGLVLGGLHEMVAKRADRSGRDMERAHIAVALAPLSLVPITGDAWWVFAGVPALVSVAACGMFLCCAGSSASGDQLGRRPQSSTRLNG